MEIPRELSSCMKKALFRLSMGDMTAGEMLEYLSDQHRKNTAFPTEIAERTVALLEQEGFLDDKRYLKLFVKRLDDRLLGPRKMKEELTRHRFPPHYVEAVLNRSVNFHRRAKKLLLQRRDLSALVSTPAGKKKLNDYLVRQGYDFSTARCAVDQISQSETDVSK